MADMTQWQQSFVQNLESLRGQWLKDFDRVMNESVAPAFERISGFVGEHGFRVSSPVSQTDRRSYKFEMAENAFLMVFFHHRGINDYMVKTECFVPGREPWDYSESGALNDITLEWATAMFQKGLDTFVTAFSAANNGDVSPDLELLATT
jgi:hypothetical protein